MISFVGCMGAKLRRSHQVDPSDLRKTTSLQKKVDTLCNSYHQSRPQSFPNLACTQNKSTKSFLLKSSEKVKASKRSDYTGPYDIKYQYVGGKDQFKLSHVRYFQKSLPHIMELLAIRLIKLGKTPASKKSRHLKVTKKPLYDAEKGTLSASLQVKYTRQDTLVANFTNTVNIKALRVDQGMVVTIETEKVAPKVSLLEKAVGQILLVPASEGLWLISEVNMTFPGFRLPSFFKSQIRKSAWDIMQVLSQFIDAPLEKELPKTPETLYYKVQSASYKVKVFSSLLETPVCETSASASIFNDGQLNINWNEVTCMKGISIPIKDLFPIIDDHGHILHLSSYFHPREYPGFEYMIRSANAPIMKDPETQTPYRPIFHPPKISAIHPIIQDIDPIQGFSLDQPTTLYDPYTAGGQTEGNIRLTVHEIDKPFEAPYLNQKLENMIHYSIYYEGFKGIFKYRYWLFDRMEFYWSYQPVIVPKVVLYGNFAHYLASSPGWITKNLLDNARVEVELIKIDSHHE